MKSQERSRTTPEAGEREDALDVALAIVSTWHAIDAALSPIMGRGGVAALYKRSLRLVDSQHPWLAPALEGSQVPLDLVALKAVLGRQSLATATAGGAALQQAFCSLLASLVGLPLTEQVLGFACSRPADVLPGEEISA